MTLRNNKTKRWVWVLVMLVLIPTLVQAQNITTLIEMPTGEGDFNSYINAVYILSISVAALLAVVKIIIAGFKYMFSDIITQKSEAKKDIRNALIGLLIVLGAVLILEIINPELTQFNLDDVTAFDTYVPPSSGGGEPPAPPVVIPPSAEVGPGYESISTDEPFEDVILPFILDCGGQVVQNSSEVRCYEIDPQIEADLRSDLASLDQQTIDDTVDQFELYLSERLITDEATLEAIDAEWSSFGDDIDVLLAINLNPTSTSNPLHESSVAEQQLEEGVCRQYQQANPSTDIQYVQGDGYGACISIS